LGPTLGFGGDLDIVSDIGGSAIWRARGGATSIAPRAGPNSGRAPGNPVGAKSGVGIGGEREIVADLGPTLDFDRDLDIVSGAGGLAACRARCVLTLMVPRTGPDTGGPWVKPVRAKVGLSVELSMAHG